MTLDQRNEIALKRGHGHILANVRAQMIDLLTILDDDVIQFGRDNH